MSPARFSVSLAVAALAVAVLELGCPGTLDDPGEFQTIQLAPCPPGYDVEKDLFQSTCAASACHDATQPTGGLDLGSPDPASRLIGVAASDPKCASRLLIDPADPGKSFLLEKLEKAHPQCGVQMPKGSHLGGAQVQCVIDWVNAQVGADGGSDAGSDGGKDAAADAASDAEAGVSDAASDAGGD